MFEGIVSAVQLGFGIEIGNVAAAAVAPWPPNATSTGCSSAVIDNSPWLVFVLVPIVSASWSVLALASLPQIVPNATAALIAGAVQLYMANALATTFLAGSSAASYIPTVIAAFSVGVFTLIYARIVGGPMSAIVTQVSLLAWHAVTDT
jgi:hypothetical protein